MLSKEGIWVDGNVIVWEHCGLANRDAWSGIIYINRSSGIWAAKNGIKVFFRGQENLGIQDREQVNTLPELHFINSPDHRRLHEAAGGRQTHHRFVCLKFAFLCHHHSRDHRHDAS